MIMPLAGHWWGSEMIQTETREKWLETAIKKLTPIFTEAGLALPKRIDVLCDRERNLKLFGLLRGMCWADLIDYPDSATIWISHFLRSVRGKDGILAVLIHELVHAAVGIKCGHRKMFKCAIRKVGLVERKDGSDYAGKKLCTKLKSIADKLGPIPCSELLI